MSTLFDHSAQGSHREERPRTVPPAQLKTPNEAESQREADELAFRQMFREAVNKYGGPDALRAAIGEKATYLSKVSEAMTGDRPIQGHWLIPLMADEKAGPIVRAYFDRVAARDEHSDEQANEDSREFIANNAMLHDPYRSFVAKKRGIKSSRVRV